MNKTQNYLLASILNQVLAAGIFVWWLLHGTPPLINGLNPWPPISIILLMGAGLILACRAGRTDEKREERYAGRLDEDLDIERARESGAISREEAFKKLNIHPEIAYRLNVAQRDVLRRELGYELRTDLPCAPSLKQMHEAFELMLTRKTGQGVRDAFPNSMSVLKEWPRQHLDTLLSEMAAEIYEAQKVKRTETATPKKAEATSEKRDIFGYHRTRTKDTFLTGRTVLFVGDDLARELRVEGSEITHPQRKLKLSPDLMFVCTDEGFRELRIDSTKTHLSRSVTVYPNKAEVVAAFNLRSVPLPDISDPQGLSLFREVWRSDATAAEQALLETNDRELLKKVDDAQNAALRRAYALIDLILKKPTDLLVVLHTAAQLRDETRAVLGMDDQVQETFHMVQAAEKDITEFKKQHTVKKVGDLLKWTEGLILQLPETHDGRNTWLLNHGRGEEAVKLRRKHPDGHKIQVSEEPSLVDAGLLILSALSDMDNQVAEDLAKRHGIDADSTRITIVGQRDAIPQEIMRVIREAVGMMTLKDEFKRPKVTRFAIMPGVTITKAALLELMAAATKEGKKPVSWDLDINYMGVLREFLGLGVDQTLPRTLLDLPLHVRPDRSFPIELQCVPLYLSQ